MIHHISIAARQPLHVSQVLAELLQGQSVPVSLDRIQSIAERAGWRMVHCRRGDNYFDVIEFWIEDRLLIELLPPEIVDRYLAVMSPESLVAAAQAAAAQLPSAA
jgi:hypothetical protein